MDWMQGVNTCRTGLIPTASTASRSVSRMFRKPSPRSELSRNRFWLTVSRTDMGSGSRDFTRRPRTMSCTCAPSSPYRVMSAAPKRPAKCSRVADRPPSQIARTCWPASSSARAAASKFSGTSRMWSVFSLRIASSSSSM